MSEPSSSTDQPLKAQRLDGKVSIITGAAKGIGEAIARRFAREGSQVILADINAQGVSDVAASINEQAANSDSRAASGELAVAIETDTSQESSVEALFDQVISSFGRLDVLVNNAGLISPMLHMLEADKAWWDRIIGVNLTGTFLCSHKAAHIMARQKSGSIINLSSVAGLVGLNTCVAYGAAKGGVRIMSKSVAVEAAQYNIRCNSVHPGVIWTNMQAQATGMNDPSGLDASAMRIPLARPGEPLDIANCILYLASDESNYVTGAEFVVDAGLTAQ